MVQESPSGSSSASLEQYARMMLLSYGIFHKGQIARFKPSPSNEITGRRFACLNKAVKFLAATAAVVSCCLASQAQTVTLGWTASTSVGVTGYRLYWGGASHSYTLSTNAGLLTQVTVPSPAPGATNYYAVTAYTAAGLESAYSTEISYAAPATNNRPPPSSLTFAADAGTITAPFVVSNHIVYQPSLTSVTSGGEAIYPFTLANANAGCRNNALNKSAFNLFQLVHAGLLKADEVERQLIDACTANGLIADGGNGGLRDILATIRSAFNGAATKPRRGLA